MVSTSISIQAYYEKCCPCCCASFRLRQAVRTKKKSILCVSSAVIVFSSASTAQAPISYKCRKRGKRRGVRYTVDSYLCGYAVCVLGNATEPGLGVVWIVRHPSFLRTSFDEAGTPRPKFTNALLCSPYPFSVVPPFCTAIISFCPRVRLIC